MLCDKNLKIFKLKLSCMYFNVCPKKNQTKPQLNKKTLKLLLCPNYKSKENQLSPKSIEEKMFIAGDR